MGFSGGSDGKESACNVEDPSLIPGLERSPGEERENDTLERSVSLHPQDVTLMPFPVAQMVKNLPAMWKTGVGSLGWEDPLEKEMETHSSILAWEKSHGQRSLADYSPWSCKESDMT